MCKLFMLTNTVKMKRLDLLRMLSKASKVLTPSDDDGFGWAAFGNEGTFGERYEGADSVTFPLIKANRMPESFRHLFTVNDCETFGKVSKLKGGLLVHSRMSTNTVDLKNSHPHWNAEFTLIHNGVVTNEGEKYEMKSSCDTEHLLHYLTKGGVDSITKNVSGYYAFGALNNRTGELTIVKDSTARLFGCYVYALDSLCYATDETHLSKILLHMKYEHSQILPVRDNSSMLFSVDGKLISDSIIEPMAKSNVITTSSKAWASSGYDSKNDTYGNKYDYWADYDRAERRYSKYDDRDSPLPMVNDLDRHAYLNEVDEPIFGMTSDNLKYLNAEGIDIGADAFEAMSSDERAHIEVIDSDTGMLAAKGG